MDQSFLTALKFTLRMEGGFSDAANDHGGATNYGVTQATFNTYLNLKNLPPQDVSTISLAETFDLYYTMYWLPGHCDQIPLHLAVCHFDWCVNHGVSGAAFALQNSVGVTMDGQIGPQTLQACQTSINAPLNYVNYRRNWYKKDVANDPTQAEFLNGWLKRCDELVAYISSI